VEPKRRLPVLKAPMEEGSEDPVRPPWQWVGFGTVAIFAVWLPLSWLATAVAARLGTTPGGQLAGVVLLAVSLGLSALAGGYLVGRWGAAGVGVREAALAGLSTALIAVALAWRGGVLLEALFSVVIAVPPAALGGRLGLRRRARGL
jgi:multisubunit Na+/H+ antiporter MnhB subunit